MGKKGVLERLKDGIVLGDGGYLLELEKRGWVRAGPFTPEVVLRRPLAVKELHTEFKAAGAEVLQALTFYASRDKLETVGLEGKLEDDEPPGRAPGPRGGGRRLPRGRQHQPHLEVRGGQRRGEGRGPPHLRRAARGAGRRGRRLRHRRDLLLARRGPARGGVREEDGPSGHGHRLLREPAGHERRQDPAECAKALVDAGADIVGINCLRSPEHTLPLIEEMRKAVRVPSPASPWASARRRTSRTSRACPSSPSSWTAAAQPQGDGRLRERRAKDMGSATSAPAAAPSPPTCARWRGRSASGRPRPAWQVDYAKPMSAYEYYDHTEG